MNTFPHLAVVVAIFCLAQLSIGCNSSHNDAASSNAENQSSKSDTECSVAQQREQMDLTKLLESIIGLSEKELVQRIGEPTEGWQSYVPDRGFQYLDFFEKTPRHLIVRFNEDDKVLSAERAPSFFGPPPG